MKIEVLYFDGCPHFPPAMDLVGEVLLEEGISAAVDAVQVAGVEEARAAEFLGSPTIRVDGMDVEPEARASGEFGFGCRTYRNNGRSQGLPSREMVRGAVRAAAQVRRLGELFWKLSPLEKRIARSVYRLLAGGEAVPVSRLAADADLQESAVEQWLGQAPGVFRDQQARIEGFWGLTVRPMKHRLIVEGRTVYGWCAWDTLFIPLILGRQAEVWSSCQLTGEEVHLRAGPAGLEPGRSDAAVVSFVLPEEPNWTRDVLAGFCDWVHFFRDRDAGLRWAKEHQGAFLLRLEEAFLAARRKVEYEFGN